MILEAILQEEKEQIKNFLKGFDLDYDSNVDLTLYLKEDGEILGTVSKDKYIIKCLAVKKEVQGTNVASSLVSQIISRIIFEGYNYYQVFTKTIYKSVFINLGFSEIVQTDEVVVLESKGNSINDYLKDLKKKLDFSLSDVASVVINANPVTLGHQHLVSKASREHDFVIVFVLEEDRSLFSFKERFSMAYLAFKDIPNVMVVPSSKYIISSLTFPTYFLKSETSALKEYALVDALIFKNYFMKELNIKYRYVGSEDSPFMQTYNKTLKEVLGESLIEVMRVDGISASSVRKLLLDKKVDEASLLIPEGCRVIFRQIALDKVSN